MQRVPSPGPAPLTQLKLLLRDLAVEGHKLRLLGGETQSGKELSELREELGEAERWNDLERRARIQTELEFLEDELGRGLGPGGKPRRSAGAAERARVNVHKRLRGLIKKIGSSLPELGQHLETSITTGLFVSYRPEFRSRHGL